MCPRPARATRSCIRTSWNVRRSSSFAIAAGSAKSGAPVAHNYCRKQYEPGRKAVQYTIESRELTNEYTHKPSFDVQPRTTTVEAGDVAEAIHQFVQENESELVSFSRPMRGRETIA